MRKNEHREIKIEYVENGFLITDNHWIDETCANKEDKYVAQEKEETIDVINKIISPKTEFHPICPEYRDNPSYGKFFCLGEKDCSFPDDLHECHPKA